MNNLVISLVDDVNFSKETVYQASSVYNGTIDIVVRNGMCSVDLDDKDFIFIVNPNAYIENHLRTQYRFFEYESK